jgi:hypothetical protein
LNSRACLGGEENLAPTGIRSPGRPARSKSPCRLRYQYVSASCYQSFVILATGNLLVQYVSASCYQSFIILATGNLLMQYVSASCYQVFCNPSNWESACPVRISTYQQAVISLLHRLLHISLNTNPYLSSAGGFTYMS